MTFRVSVCLYRVVGFLALIALVSGHGGHGHAHDHGGHHGHSHEDSEPAAYKWSKQANIVEDEIMEEDIIDLPPAYSNEVPSEQKLEAECVCHYYFLNDICRRWTQSWRTWT